LALPLFFSVPFKLIFPLAVIEDVKLIGDDLYIETFSFIRLGPSIILSSVVTVLFARAKPNGRISKLAVRS